jgi:hypothetical protein
MVVSNVPVCSAQSRLQPLVFVEQKMGPFAGPVALECVNKSPNSVVINQFSKYIASPSSTSPLSVAKPIYNDCKCVGIYTSNFICDKEELESTTISPQIMDNNTNNFQSVSSINKCSKCKTILCECNPPKSNSVAKSLKLGSNRIVDLFGVVTSITLLENALLASSIRPNLSAESPIEDVFKVKKENDTTNGYIAKRLKLSSNICYTSPQQATVKQENKQQSQTIVVDRSVCQFADCIKWSQGSHITDYVLRTNKVNLNVRWYSILHSTWWWSSMHIRWML